MATTPPTSSLSDPASISVNRAGQFTPWQRQHLQPPSLLGTQIVLVLSAAVIALGAYFFLIRVQDMVAGRVETVEGEVERTVDNSGDGGPTYYYKVGALTFLVSLPAYNALVSGQRYRIYYLPKTKRLVSIEPLP